MKKIQFTLKVDGNYHCILVHIMWSKSHFSEKKTVLTQFSLHAAMIGSLPNAFKLHKARLLDANYSFFYNYCRWNSSENILFSTSKTMRLSGFLVKYANSELIPTLSSKD